VIACTWCNNSRGDLPVLEWRAKLAYAEYNGTLEMKRIAVLERLRNDELPEEALL
jgi:hypothetical protein